MVSQLEHTYCPTHTILRSARHEIDLLGKKLLSAALGPKAQTVRLRKQTNVYTCGDEDMMLYWIQSGCVKLVLTSSTGKECLLDVYSSGDFFGESCLAGLDFRLETAITMEDTILRRVAAQSFITAMDCAELRGFIRQLNRRSLEHMLSITDMVTMGSEFRLGKTLLRLAARLGTTHPAGTLISCRISQEELSHMVGTTRPRITEFMNRFRALGLVRISTARRLIIKEPALLSHLASLD